MLPFVYLLGKYGWFVRNVMPPLVRLEILMFVISVWVKLDANGGRDAARRCGVV
jgi:hypothetical protein